jgi:hypothetical protein
MSEEIIKDRDYYIKKMCFTMRPDFAMFKYDDCSYITSGMSDEEREDLRSKMARLYDVCFADDLSNKSDKI